MKTLLGALVLALGLSVVAFEVPALAQSKKVEKKVEKKSAPKGLAFETYKDKGGEWRFRIVDGEGNNLAGSSKGYEKKADMEKVIKSIQDGAAKATTHEEKAAK